jgi:hypothetical protein
MLKLEILDHVFDVTSLKDSIRPKGHFSIYAFKDISYALTKNSILEEDVQVVGYSDLSARELTVLDDWVSLFRCVLNFHPPRSLIADLFAQTPFQNCGQSDRIEMYKSLHNLALLNPTCNLQSPNPNQSTYIHVSREQVNRCGKLFVETQELRRGEGAARRVAQNL